MARAHLIWISTVTATTNDRPQPSAWGEKLPFNTVCGEFNSPSGGWVHDVAFSPSGDALAFASEYRSSDRIGNNRR